MILPLYNGPKDRVSLGKFQWKEGKSGGLEGGLSSFAKPLMEVAIRTCIYNDVKFTVENTPQQYFKC